VEQALEELADDREDAEQQVDDDYDDPWEVWE
jgi:hypothetical protein